MFVIVGRKREKRERIVLLGGAGGIPYDTEEEADMEAQYLRKKYPSLEVYVIAITPTNTLS